MMQYYLRQIVLQWFSLILILLPYGSLQAQSLAPTASPTLSASLIDDATQEFDAATIQATMDALLEAKVDALIGQLGVEDKIGQLFLVHFTGNDTSIESDVAMLVHAYRIGGVVISPTHGNIANARGADTPLETAHLVNRLQALAYGKLLTDEDALLDGPLMENILLNRALDSEEESAAFVESIPALADVIAEADRPAQNIPLFVGVEQLGDDLAVTSLRRHFTELPNQMTVGATWNPKLANAIGTIVGQELSTVGVNLLLGPTLDIYTQPRPDNVGRLGVHMFGSNAYWAGELGKGYINGIHNGSNGQTLTVVRHFPGQGGVDRLPEYEVATIQADIDELRATSLSPFRAVTKVDPASAAVIDDQSVTDMMMSSHMRFSSVQPTGSGRNPPISLSPELRPLLINEGFSPWMESGLVVSGPLGVPAIQRFYQTNDGGFPIRQVAKEAFVAGNDLLYLGHADGENNWEEEQASIEATIGFFQEQYALDPVFADQVDEALRRILLTKLRLYTDRTALEAEAVALLAEHAVAASGPISNGLPSEVASILPSANLLANQDPIIPLAELLTSRADLAIFAEDAEHGTNANAVARQIARDSLTVLYPDISEPSESLPQPPQADDQIVIFTDSRLEQECADCRAEVSVGPNDIANIILRLYGPEATGQISPQQLTSLTFAELVEVLESEPEGQDGVDAGTGAAPTVLFNPSPLPENEIIESDTITATDNTGSETAVDRSAQIEEQIAAAEWIIFAMLDVDPTRYPSSVAVRRFLSERRDQLEDKQVIVLALHAPYFLDATEISTLSSYLGVYSKSKPFLENAVRAIFRSYVPAGAPPVSVPGTRFADLDDRLQPDPRSTIAMQVQSSDGEVLSASVGENLDQPSVLAGDTIRVQVGPIIDRNGHNVQDGLPVNFRVIYEGSELVLNVEPASTKNGIAVRDILLDRSGTIRVSASSGNASTGEPFSLLVAGPPAEPESSAAVSQPVASPEDGAEGVPGGEEAIGAVDPATMGSTDLTAEDRASLAALVIALITLLGTLSLLLIVQIRVLPRPALVHHMLWTVIVGLIAYIAYGVGLLPGANMLNQYFGLMAAALVVFVGMVGTMLWLQLRSS